MLMAVSGVKRVGRSTEVPSDFNAVATMSFLSLKSLSEGRLGSPQGCGIRVPCITRFAPMVRAKPCIAVIMATGSPPRSNSFVIAAPLRVQEPQVATSKTPSTPADLRSLEISLPMRCIAANSPPAPTVT